MDVDTPQTLFDINPTYPKLSPDAWAIMNANISLTTSELMDNNTNTLYLTYSKDDHQRRIIRLLHTHKILLMVFIWVLLLLIGFVILFIIIIRSCKNKKKYASNNKNRSQAITVGGETSSLSGWLTKRRFQQYEDGNNDENEPLTGKHRWASSSEESDLSDNDLANKVDFRNVILKN